MHQSTRTPIPRDPIAHGETAIIYIGVHRIPFGGDAERAARSACMRTPALRSPGAARRWCPGPLYSDPRMVGALGRPALFEHRSEHRAEWERGDGKGPRVSLACARPPPARPKEPGCRPTMVPRPHLFRPPEGRGYQLFLLLRQ